MGEPDKKTNLRQIASGLRFGSLGLLIALIVIVNILFSGFHLRWDATEDKIYSLSDGTATILKALPTQVTVKYYFTDDAVTMPAHVRAYGRRVQDLLNEYAIASDGNLTLEVVAPKPDSEEEDWARTYGVESVPTAGGSALYLGLVAISQDKEEVIPFLDPTKEASLEYDITRSISRVTRPKNQVIGVMAGLDMFGNPALAMQNPQAAKKWFFLEELEKTYTVKQIAIDADQLPADLDLLMVIQPRSMTPQQVYAVDQFVLKGGRLLVFSDPMAVTDTSRQPAPAQNPMAPLFAAWGVEISPKAVVDFNAATRLMGQNNQVESNPSWLSLAPENMNPDSIITSGLESVLLPVAGEITISEKSPFAREILLSSSENAALFDAHSLRFGTQMVRRQFKATKTAYPLAVQLSGTATTAFPDGSPGSLPHTDPSVPSTHLVKGERPANIVIIADADLLFDAYYMSRQSVFGFAMARIFNDNLNLVLNTTEMLTGSPELIRIRTRAVTQRPFTKVQELEREAQARWLVREQDLMAKADETNRKLQELEQQKDRSEAFVLTEEQEAEIRRFHEEKIRINEELKTVRRNLRAEIDALGNRLKVLNIFGVPVLITMAGIFFALHRRKKAQMPA